MKLQGKQKAAGKKQSNTPWPAAGVAEGGGLKAKDLGYVSDR